MFSRISPLRTAGDIGLTLDLAISEAAALLTPLR
jgi:hypothetical protein